MGGSAAAVEKNFLPANRPKAAAISTARANAAIKAPEDFFFSIGTVPDDANLVDDEDCAASVITDVREESSERLNRLRSARSSAADWQRISRSFSRALLMISSSLGGSPGFRRTAAVGCRLRIASVITAEVSPWNGRTPVAIS